MLEGIRIVLSEAIPRDQLWFLPRDMGVPRVAASGERNEPAPDAAAEEEEAPLVPPAPAPEDEGGPEQSEQ